MYLNQEELARRWRVSPRTLERWRWLKTGPRYLKLGGKVVYALSDVEAYERKRRARTHASLLGSWPHTPQPASSDTSLSDDDSAGPRG
jgi:hypothetical protein